MNEALKPGIYFGLPEKIYHDDPALSRSDCVNLLDTPNTYWINSGMNPEREQMRAKKRQNKEMVEGSIAHMMLLQPHLFNDTYQIIGDGDWDNSKPKIEYEKFMELTEAIKVLRGGKDSNLFLSGGYAEVTIVFDDMDTRFRARHDYFAPNLSTDFKRTFSLDDWHLKRSFMEYGLDIQMRLYKRSRERFKEQFLAGEAHVYGDVPKEWFQKFMTAELNEFVFIFQRDKKPFPFRPLMPEDDTEESGNIRIQKAVEIYRKNFEAYGVKPWPVCEGRIQPFSMYYGSREVN